VEIVGHGHRGHGFLSRGVHLSTACRQGAVGREHAGAGRRARLHRRPYPASPERSTWSSLRGGDMTASSEAGDELDHEPQQGDHHPAEAEIGRASCRERVRIWVGEGGWMEEWGGEGWWSVGE